MGTKLPDSFVVAGNVQLGRRPAEPSPTVNHVRDGRSCWRRVACAHSLAAEHQSRTRSWLSARAHRRFSWVRYVMLLSWRPGCVGCSEYATKLTEAEYLHAGTNVLVWLRRRCDAQQLGVELSASTRSQRLSYSGSSSRCGTWHVKGSNVRQRQYHCVLGWLCARNLLRSNMPGGDRLEGGLGDKHGRCPLSMSRFEVCE